MVGGRNLRTNKSDQEEHVFSRIPLVLKINLTLLPGMNCCLLWDNSCCSAPKINPLWVPLLSENLMILTVATSMKQKMQIFCSGRKVLHNLPSTPSEIVVLSLPSHSATQVFPVAQKKQESTVIMTEFGLQVSKEFIWANSFQADHGIGTSVTYERFCFSCYPCKKLALLSQTALLRNEDLADATSEFQINSQISFNGAHILTQFLLVKSMEVLWSASAGPEFDTSWETVP